MPYTDYVKEALDCLTGPLADYVGHEMRIFYGDGWKYEIARWLGECAPGYDAEDGEFKKSLTLKNLLVIMEKMDSSPVGPHFGESVRIWTRALSGWVSGLEKTAHGDLPRVRAAVILEFAARLCEWAAPGSQNAKTVRALREKTDIPEEEPLEATSEDAACDAFETVIILHQCFLVREQRERRDVAADNCSWYLRGWAKNAGLEISGTYRDKAFAEREMKIMDAVIDHKIFRDGEVPDIYFDMDETYLFDREDYERVLDMAIWGGEEGWGSILRSE